MLEENLRLNGIQNRVKICPQALSEKEGELNLYVPKQDHGFDETSCSLNADFRSEHSQVIAVPVITLDSYLKDGAVQHVDLVKIDVETHEPQVLRGAVEMLKTHRPYIFVEVLFCADTAALDAIAQEHKYIPISMTYDRLEICKRVEHRAGHINYFFCPEEKLQSLKALALRIGYPTVEI